MTDAVVSIAADEGPSDQPTLGLERIRVGLAGEARCNDDEEAGAEYRCSRCGDAVEGADDPRDCFGGEPGEAHDPERVPLSWANSAAISLDESEDSITVSISVGDPRGAFAMCVERVRWTEPDGTECDELRLSVPTPSDGWLHMPLTPLASRGYFRIGA